MDYHDDDKDDVKKKKQVSFHCKKDSVRGQTIYAVQKRMDSYSEKKR
jgi:hypothetical protein